MTRIYVDVPDAVAKEVENTGVRESGLLAEAIQDALRRHAAGKLAEVIASPTDAPEMSLEEIQEEVHAYRREKRAKRETGS